MNPRRQALGVVVVVVLVVLGAVGFGAVMTVSTPTLEERWTSATGSTVDGNHHAVAATTVGGTPTLFVPQGGRAGETGCGLLALDTGGEPLWRAPVTPTNCTIHAVGDPAVARWPDDRLAVLAATSDRQLSVRDPATGSARLTLGLEDYGYASPQVADLTGDGRSELLVADVSGTVYAFGIGQRADPVTVQPRWTRAFDEYAWATPIVADVDADDGLEVVLGLGDGQVRVLDGATGQTEQLVTVGDPISWMASGDADQDGLPELFAATSAGELVAIDGSTGIQEWRRQLPAFAAVGPVADGDGDGRSELYATARDGRVRALDAASGQTRWTSQLTPEAVQMMPPPSLGDVDGDGRPELVGVSHDGRVTLHDPADGTRLASYERPGRVYTRATLADLDGDGAMEIYVPYGDGRVVALVAG